MRSNCLIYAFTQLVRTWHTGGAIIVCKSRFAANFGVSNRHPKSLLPHLLHVHDGVVSEFVPTLQTLKTQKRRGLALTVLIRLLTFWTFDGEVRQRKWGE